LSLDLPKRLILILTISTPVGLYTPDWAIVKRNIHGKQQTIYFVVETKGDSNDEQQREVERVKIECAQKHFEALGFEVMPNAPLVDKDSKYVVKTDYRDFALEG